MPRHWPFSPEHRICQSSMSSILRYGANSRVEFELPSAALVADCRTPRGAPVADLTGAASAALEQPLDFPPLRQSVVSGDRVAVALEAAVPQASLLVSAVVSHLLGAGIAAGDIFIVHPGRDRAGADDALRSELPAEVRKSIEIVAHDPAHRDGLSYLAANRDGDPIYINRRLVDADVVLPIGCIRLPSTPGYFGVNATLYPTFSDAATLDRYHATDAEPSDDETSRRRQEADEIAWLLGVLLTIQVVPAAAGGVLHVVAGNCSSRLNDAEKRCVNRRGSSKSLDVRNLSSPRSTGARTSRRGTTSVGRLPRPPERSPTTARLHYARIWRRRQARPSLALLRLAILPMPSVTFAGNIRPMPALLTHWPRRSSAVESTYSADLTNRLSKTWEWRRSGLRPTSPV